MGFSPADKRWQKYNQKLEKLMKANDFFGLGTTYYEMAAFVEKEGSDPKPYRELGFKMKHQAEMNRRNLEGYLESGYVSAVEIFGAADSCDLCKKSSGKRLSVQDAIISRPIPMKDCTHKYGYRCVYLPVSV